MKLILGSSSPFRKLLLEKLQVDFDICSPDIDESSLENESPESLVKRLTIEKAKAVAEQFTDALIISSDQIALHQDRVIGKPGTHEVAVKQLSSFSGETVRFITGLCLYNSFTHEYQYHEDLTLVKFRQLSKEQITGYLEKDKPYQCAGSFKSEGLGAALFESLETKDPNALIGLPIIALVKMLEAQGMDVLSN